MKAIIIAAGYGSRLGNLTKDIPKALLDINGKSILERQSELLRAAGIKEIIIVTGPNKEKFTDKNFQYIEDNCFEEHEQLGSLMAARKHFDDDIIILFSDILFDNQILSGIINSEAEIVIGVDLGWEKNYVGRTEHPISQADLVLIKNNLILKIQKNLIPDEDSRIGEFIGIMKMSRSGTKKFLEHYKQLENNFRGKFHTANSIKKAYLTDMFQDIIDSKIAITPIFVKGNWCEIDTNQDLEHAKKLFE